MQEAHAYCEALVRTADKDRYLASLFAPAAARRHIHALNAFASEIARVRDAARAPMPGEIRLQWWRDMLKGEGRGEVSANPVAAALLDTVASCALPTQRLIALQISQTSPQDYPRLHFDLHVTGVDEVTGTSLT